MSPENNSASIIIPAFNEEEGIEKVLAQLKSLNLGEKSEIIVVDDGSLIRLSEWLQSTV